MLIILQKDVIKEGWVTYHTLVDDRHKKQLWVLSSGDWWWWVWWCCWRLRNYLTLSDHSLQSLNYKSLLQTCFTCLVQLIKSCLVWKLLLCSSFRINYEEDYSIGWREGLITANHNQQWYGTTPPFSHTRDIRRQIAV